MELSSAEEFVRLRSSADPEEQRMAAHSSATVDVWVDVIERYSDVRFWVAQNKTIPVEIIELLSGDSDVGVRAMIASKNRTPPGTLRKLARDADESVRARVAWNKRTPLDVRESLLSDNEDLVRKAAEDRLAQM